jgi:hypothetical protein
VVRHVRVRPVAVDARLLVHELLDESSVRQHDRRPARSEFQREDAPVRLGPACEREVRAFGWDLVQVA